MYWTNSNPASLFLRRRGFAARILFVTMDSLDLAEALQITMMLIDDDYDVDDDSWWYLMMMLMLMMTDDDWWFNFDDWC